jgi:CBS-domain-containing membrane protein
MNILFLLTPKKDVVCVQEDDTLRQAIEKMLFHGYTAVPVLDKEGRYICTLGDEDLLKAIKENKLDWELLMKLQISSLEIRRKIVPLGIDKDVKDLLPYIASQNFVPVVDDSSKFIGIVTRQSVINYLIKELNGTKKL